MRVRSLFCWRRAHQTWTGWLAVSGGMASHEQGVFWMSLIIRPGFFSPTSWLDIPADQRADACRRLHVLHLFEVIASGWRAVGTTVEKSSSTAAPFRTAHVVRKHFVNVHWHVIVPNGPDTPPAVHKMRPFSGPKKCVHEAVLVERLGAPPAQHKMGPFSGSKNGAVGLSWLSSPV